MPPTSALLQDQTDEAVRLLDDQAQASIGGARDIRAALERARRGGRLTAPELLDVAETLGPPDRFADAAGRLDAGRTWPELRDELDPAPALRERIERSVDESGRGPRLRLGGAGRHPQAAAHRPGPGPRAAERDAALVRRWPG